MSRWILWFLRFSRQCRLWFSPQQIDFRRVIGSENAFDLLPPIRQAVLSDPFPASMPVIPVHVFSKSMLQKTRRAAPGVVSPFHPLLFCLYFVSFFRPIFFPSVKSPHWSFLRAVLAPLQL